MRSSYWGESRKGCGVIVGSRNDLRGFTYFLDFLVIECTCYKNETRRIVDAKCPADVAAGYFILNRRCWKEKKSSEKFSLLLAQKNIGKCNAKRGQSLELGYGQFHIILLLIRETLMTFRSQWTAVAARFDCKTNCSTDQCKRGENFSVLERRWKLFLC